MMCGIWFAAPAGMLTAAVSGLMSSGRCITTVPRSNGPTCALVIDTTENGAPAYGTGEIDLARGLREHGADAGFGDRVPDFRARGTRGCCSSSIPL